MRTDLNFLKKYRVEFLLAMIAISLFSLFQNCSLSSESSSSVDSSAAQLQNGQPYDGKPYVIRDDCHDGTVVESRIVLSKSGKGTLYREGCKNVEPREVSSSEIAFDDPSGETVLVNDRKFSLEKPAIPLPGVISWFYQLTGTLEPRPASIYIIDLFENSEATIDDLIEAGHTVICSVSAGTVESWRPDADAFAAQDIGYAAHGTTDERWLNTESDSVRTIMADRLDLAKSKGCHGVDFDSVDGYANPTGFDLNPSTQLDYNRFLAFAAHDRDLILSLNNAPELAGELALIFDFVIAEQCFEYNECDEYQSFIARDKPVLAAEYTEKSSLQCQQAADMQISLAYFDEALDGSRYETCAP